MASLTGSLNLANGNISNIINLDRTVLVIGSYMMTGDYTEVSTQNPYRVPSTNIGEFKAYTINNTNSWMPQPVLLPDEGTYIYSSSDDQYYPVIDATSPIGTGSNTFGVASIPPGKSIMFVYGRIV